MYESFKHQKRAPDEPGDSTLSAAAHAPVHAAGEPGELTCWPLAGLLQHTPGQEWRMTVGPCCVPRRRGPYAG